MADTKAHEPAQCRNKDCLPTGQMCWGDRPCLYTRQPSSRQVVENVPLPDPSVQDLDALRQLRAQELKKSPPNINILNSLDRAIARLLGK